MDNLRAFTYDHLPVGCPFVVGGGLIRDSIMGGRPSDIDIWLPSNLPHTRSKNVEQFARDLVREYPGADIQILFRGPDSNGQGGGGDTAMFGTGDQTIGLAATHDYGDVANHWVIEMQIEGWPRVNFMRNMTAWTNPQDFFNGLMRCFDIDHCMFFIGWMPNQSNVNTVIMPEHMLQRDTRRFRLSELHWNQYRLDRTHAARIEARIIKMRSKYSYYSGGLTPNEIHRNGCVIPVDQIIAKPVLLGQALRLFSRQLPEPTWHNTREVSEWVLSEQVRLLTESMRVRVQREANQVNIARG